jgi:hypothetical protein
MAKKFTKDQWLGLVLILAALLIWVPLPWIPAKEGIGALIVIIIGLYKLIFS